MLEVLKTPELWIALAVVAILIFGMAHSKNIGKRYQPNAIRNR